MKEGILVVRAQTKNKMQDVAKERIAKLFELARKEFDKNPERSNKYVKQAREIAMRYNVRFPKSLKIQFCKKCGIFWVQGKNVTVRTNKKTKATEYECKECKAKKRFGY